MGLFDNFIKNWKRSPTERAIHKLLSRDTAHEDRMGYIEALGKEGTEPAIEALLRRFEFDSDKQREDKLEKDYTGEVLESLGAKVVPLAEKHLAEARRVARPALVLRALAGQEAMIGSVLAALAKERERANFKVDKTLRLLRLLQGVDDERIVPSVLPCLEDFDEGVRYDSMRILLDSKDERARGGLLAAWVNPDEESERMRQEIRDGFVRQGWSVEEERSKVESLLPQGWWVGSDGLLREPGQAGAEG